MAILFKLSVYLLLIVSNSRLGFERALLFRNALAYVSDSVLILLLVTVESQFDSFNALRRDFRMQKRKGGGKQ